MFPFLPVVVKEAPFTQIVKQFIMGEEKLFLVFKAQEGRKSFPMLLDGLDTLKEENIGKLFPLVTPVEEKDSGNVYHIVTLGNPKGPYILVSHCIESRDFVDARFLSIKKV